MRGSLVSWMLGFALLGGLAAHAGMRLSQMDSQTLDADAIRVIDGDTVAIGQEHIRLVEPDAPEIVHPRCNAEFAKGLRAADRLQHLLTGPVTIARTGRRDRYGRTLASVTTGQGNVAEILIREGLALRYESGADAYRQRALHWCPPP